MNESLQIQSNKIKLINFVWFFLMIELAGLFLVTYYFIVPSDLTPSDHSSYLIVLYLSYLLSIIIIPVSFKFYDYFKKKSKLLISEAEKAEKYFMIKLFIFAAIEIPAVLCLLAYYLNEISEPLYMFGIVFVAGLLLKPSKNQFVKDFLIRIDDNDLGEIVYMPDEEGEQKEEDINNLS